jgi:glycosyltransferase involved in cell wall biosynthesis
MGNKEFEKLPISAVMVIYNEEKVIERALRSFCNLVDETIIIHDGKCSDKSLEIARKYTNKIFKLEHIGHAERHRVKTYEMARNNWVLQLDADEYLSSELAGNLKDLIRGSADIYEVSWSTFLENKHYFWHHKRALFKKNKVYFIGAIQESVKPIDKSISIQKTGYALLHEPSYHNATFAIFQKKWRKWAKLQAGELTEYFFSIPKWNCSLDDWEDHRRLRIRHPILLGMIATSAYHVFHCAKKFLKHKNPYILRMGFFACLYHIHLYYYLNKLRKNAKK